MKIKSMIAALAASAITIGALAVPTFAADGDPVWYGGKVGVNSKTTGWKESGKEWAVNDDKIGSTKFEPTKTDDGKYTIRFENPFGDGVAEDDTYVQAWIQNWGPDDFKLVSVYFEGIDYNYPMDKMDAADSNHTAYLVGGTEADPTIGEKTVEDANKVTAIVWTFEMPQAAGKAAETTTAAPADTTAAAATTTKAAAAVTTTKAADTKKTDSAKTGDAGVGVAVAALGLAAAAAFTARKKH